jgi:hypothetical protein
MMMNLPQGAGVVVPRQSIKPLVGSYGVTRPSVTVEPSRLDILNDPILPVDPQPYGVLNEVDPGSELVEGSALFGRTASHNEMLMVESGFTGHTVSSLFVPL